MSNVLFVAAALSSVILAGCAATGGGTDGTDSIVPEEEFAGYEATADTGVIRGVVIDEAIRPIAGAEVSLTVPGGSRNATSSDSGAFGFAGLGPGTYFLRTSKAGYTTVQASTEVAAGVGEPPITRVLLAADPQARPFFEILSWQGYIQCSTRFVVNALAACSTIPGSDDNFTYRVHPQSVPAFAQSEMVWDSTQALGDGMKVQYTDDSDGLDNYVVAVGGSPLVISANQALMAGKGVGEDTGLLIRIFAGSVDGTRPPVCPPGPCEGASLVVNQSFSVYTVLFYNMLPREGWTFGADGEPPKDG